MQPAIYPVQFAVDYPDRPLDRLTTLLRLFVAIPILIVLGSVAGGTWEWSTHNNGATAAGGGAGGLLFFRPLLLIVFPPKEPRWGFGWQLGALGFRNRVGVLLGFLGRRFPSTPDQP